MTSTLRLLAMLTVLVTPALAAAAEHVHVVGEGQMLSTIARGYYGSAWKSVYIVARNTRSRQSAPKESGDEIMSTQTLLLILVIGAVFTVALLFGIDTT